MGAARFILALDAGTTSSRSLIFDERGRVVAQAQREFTQYFPQPGWVEHDAQEIWNTQRATMIDALRAAGLTARDIAAIGITNQRETTVLWDRATGAPVAPAIVWQDRRTAAACESLRAAGLESEIATRTGLLLDPYFSATKLAWLLDHVPGARARAERGELAFGTVDSWLLFKLTAHRRHVTDATNASRTLLYNLRDGDLGRSPARTAARAARLPARDRRHLPGARRGLEIDLDGVKLPLTGIAGDQQAALFGQGCFKPGMAKNTYGTGCFALMNIGAKPRPSRHRLLTHAWRCGAAPASTRWRAACSWAAPRCSGCATVSASSNAPRTSKPWPPRCPTPAMCTWCRHLRDWEHRNGMPRRAAPSSDSRAARRARTWRAPRSRASPSRPPISSRPCSRIAATRSSELRVDGGAARNDLLLQFQADLLGVPVLQAGEYRNHGVWRRRTRRPRLSACGNRRPNSGLLDARASLRAPHGRPQTHAPRRHAGSRPWSVRAAGRAIVSHRPAPADRGDHRARSCWPLAASTWWQQRTVRHYLAATRSQFRGAVRAARRG